MKRRNEELEEMFNNAGEKVKDEVKKMEGLVQQMEQYLKSAKELKKDMGYVTRLRPKVNCSLVIIILYFHVTSHQFYLRRWWSKANDKVNYYFKIFTCT